MNDGQAVAIANGCWGCLYMDNEIGQLLITGFCQVDTIASPVGIPFCLVSSIQVIGRLNELLVRGAICWSSLVYLS